MITCQLLSQKSHFKRAKARSLNAGEEVLLMLPTDSNKLMMRWKGPYVIQDNGVNDFPGLKNPNVVSMLT